MNGGVIESNYKTQKRVDDLEDRVEELNKIITRLLEKIVHLEQRVRRMDDDHRRRVK